MEQLTSRLERLDLAIQQQRSFLHRVPDPDTRERAEGNLSILIEMRDDVAARLAGDGAPPEFAT